MFVLNCGKVLRIIFQMITRSIKISTRIFAGFSRIGLGKSLVVFCFILWGKYIFCIIFQIDEFVVISIGDFWCLPYNF